MYIAEAPDQAPDFFISRAGPDAAFAAEIGRILEDEGKTVVLQQWDFTNRNFMERMHAALESGARVIALLSNDYLASDHCKAEWQNAIAHDPLNRNGRLVVLRVGESTPTGLLTALAYWDLVPVRDNPGLLREVVLSAVQPGRHKDIGSIGQYWRAPRPVVHPEIRPTSSFTGREAELAAIHDFLWSGHAAAITQPVAAHGLGGIGKSALAREYAHRHQSKYAGVWWLNAAALEDDSPGLEGVERALVELGAVFVRGLEMVEDRARAARHALDFIAHGGFEKPWLLVYDNVDDGSVLRDWSPIGNVHALLTTRISGWPAEVRTVEVEEWPLQEAIAYLHAESGRPDLTVAEAREVAEALGRLPLALSHASALLRARPNITAAAYVEQLARRMAEAPRDAEYPRAVFATYQEALVEAERDAPGAIAVMSLAAFFAPDDIVEELFRQPAECYPPALAGLVRAAGAVEESIGALARLSLVDFSWERRTFSAHRLVLAAARDALGDSAPTWSRSALWTVALAFPVPEPGNWANCERLVPHVRVVALHVREDNLELALLLGRAAAYLRERAALADVVPLYQRAQGILERLAAADPDNARLQRNLAVAHGKIGDVLCAQGDLVAALDNYRADFVIAERLAAADPGNAGLRYDLSVSHDRIGDVQGAQGQLALALDSYDTSRAIRDRLTAADPNNAHWQRALSVSHEKIGDVQSAQGNFAAAWRSYCACLAIREQLAAADADDADRQFDLGIASERIGNVLMGRRRLACALRAHERRHQIVTTLVKRNPDHAGWQHDLALSHIKIGDVQSAQDHPGAALDSYRASLAICEQLTKADPHNARWQRELSGVHSRIGNVQSAQADLTPALNSYRSSGDIIERLAATDPTNTGWQRDLSVSHEKMGDVQNDLGALGAALESHRAALAIRKRLAAADPNNAQWQRDLSVSHDRIGDVQGAQGHLALALESYRAALTISERLAAADPDNVFWQHDLRVTQVKVAEIAIELRRGPPRPL